MTTLLRRAVYSFCCNHSRSSSFITFRMSSTESPEAAVGQTSPLALDGTEAVNKRPLEEESSAEPAAKVQKSENSSKETSADETVKKVKIPKKKVAMLLSYCGVGYQGMQINPGTRTIEKDLVNALYKAGCVPEGSNMGKMNFQRCARTDKGVSAIGQVVSLKMLLLENLVEKINKHLPSVIQVMDVKRTTGGFNSKHHCNYRTYMYLLPTYSFQSIEEITTEKYRITDEKLKEINEMLAVYKGTHNFHNFTSGKLHDDMSAQRYIMDFVCEKAFVDEGIEFAVMRVKGQSFMLHQIRKMIGLIIAIARGYASKSTMDKAFKENKLDIPRAPGLGLVLESVHYDWYNKKWSGDGVHESLSWEDCKEKQDEFKRKHIYPNIIIREKYNKSMMHWLSTLPLHTYDVIEAHNPMRGFLIAEKSKMEGQTGSSNVNEIPPDVDVAGIKPGQTPEEFLKTLPKKEEEEKSNDCEESSASLGKPKSETGAGNKLSENTSSTEGANSKTEVTHSLKQNTEETSEETTLESKQDSQGEVTT